MRVFVAGANGAVGRRLVPMLVASGHEVTGTATSRKSADAIRARAPSPSSSTAWTLPGSARRWLGRRRCDHPRDDRPLGNARLPPLRSLVRADEPAADRGHGDLLAAAKASGVQRFVAQSFTGWSNSRSGAWIKTEDDPLDPHPVKEQTETLAAIKFLERAVLEAPLEGIVVRYGALYGPGSSETLADILRKRMFPVIGNGAGIVSSTHVDDAAVRHPGRARARPARRLQHRRRRTGAVPEFIPAIAEALGAKPPLHIPAWLGRLLAGEVAVTMMTEGRGSSNAKAKRGWAGSRSGRAGVMASATASTRRCRYRRGDTGNRPRSRPGVTPSSRDGRRRRGLCRPAAAPVLDRLPDAGERQRGGGHRPGVVVRYSGLRLRHTAVQSPKAFLSAVATRLALDHLKSARVQRESYVGEWLPEPLVTDDGAGDPAARPSGRLAVDVVPPAARAAHAGRAGRVPAPRRVRLRLRGSQRHRPAGRRQHAASTRFEPAASSRQTGRGLMRPRPSATSCSGTSSQRRVVGTSVRPIELLAEDVIVHGDGGGNVPQWSAPIVGADKVARMFATSGSGCRRIGATSSRIGSTASPASSSVVRMAG